MKLKELTVEEFLNDKQIIKYITKNPNKEIISNSEPKLEIIDIKEVA